MPERVIVLGGSGMLGSMIVDYLSRDLKFKLAATVRSEALAEKCRKRLPEVDWRFLDAGISAPDNLGAADGCGWIINAIGITKPLIRDDNAAEVERALLVNSLFPHRLARYAEATGARVLQIATDCVYSGKKGGYREDDGHDALDVYGKSKSLGEVASPNVHHLRCSIIGPEPKEHKFLLDWFTGQPRGVGVSGYTNHDWNGVTTLHFAKLCHSIIVGGIGLGDLQHIVPGGEITKCRLLESFGRSYHREDVKITPAEAAVVIDRTLATNREDVNRALWAAAGYAEPPSIPEMVDEMARFDFRLGGL